MISPPIRVLLFLLLLGAGAAAPAARAEAVRTESVRSENVSQCFTVHEMVKTEEIRYLVDAVSRCTHVYDAVYVMVSFFDAAGKHLDDGVWATYWCRPGRREVHEFAIPSNALGFSRVVLKKVTTDWREALR